MIPSAERIGSELIRRWEGLRLSPYLCPAGIATIGYGSTTYEDGTAVTLLDPAISRDRAEAMLLHSIRKTFLPAVIALCPTLNTPERIGAILDFAYNLGKGNLRASTLRRAIAAEDWSWAAVELKKWVFARGHRLPGLVARRAQEALLIQ